MLFFYKLIQTTTKAGVEIIDIILINEKREHLVYDVLPIKGKDGITIAETVIGSVELDASLGIEIWRKTDSILSDTASGQLAANKRIVEHIKKRINDEDTNIQVLWCSLHTSANLQTRAKRGSTDSGNGAFTELKLLFGSANRSGYHKEDLKNE